jgi:pyruvate dehydrogenase E2 component (dihydrolipoamide acetyltransferase)
VAKETIRIPDLGGADSVEVIEVCVAVGDEVTAEDSLLVLESDKASMEVPAPRAGRVSKVLVKEGDSVAEGDEVFELEIEAGDEVEVANPQTEVQPPVAEESEAAEESVTEPPSGASVAGSGGTKMVEVPDIGGEAEVIELCLEEGASVAEGDSLVVLESDKASMEVPAPYAGILSHYQLKVGDVVSAGSLLAEMQVVADTRETETNEAPAPVSVAEPRAPESAAATEFRSANPASARGAEPVSGPTVTTHPGVYAGPAVRKMARELGVVLEAVSGSGPRGRVLKEDLQAYVKDLMQDKATRPAGVGLDPIPDVDFSQFGPIQIEPRSKLAKLTAANMHRSWTNLPHVTQFDDADVTELEAFRKNLKSEAEQRGVKLTPLPFLLKAAAVALQAYPQFNVSLSNSGEDLVLKRYFHIGMAVDTSVGLLVPVIRDVDQKSIWQLAAETAEIAQKAKERKLKPAEMQGGCFTISSLGGIGGAGFTPIINAPEVAIIGVSRMAVKPVWDGNSFQPKKMLPLSLSYDHRAINGADAGQFLTYYCALLADIRRMVL